MKTLLLIIFLLPLSLSAQVTVKTDEFTGKVTMVGTIQSAQNDGSHLSNMMAMRVEGATYIVIGVTSDSWVHLSDNVAHALSGTAKTRVNVSVLKVSQDTEFEGSKVYTTETIAIRLNTHLISNPFLIRLGSVIYTVPESVVADVREIGRKL